MIRVLPGVLSFAGTLCVVAGAYMIFPPVAFILAGLLLFACALGLMPERG